MILSLRMAGLLILCLLGLAAPVSAQDADEGWITYVVDQQIYQMRADGTDPQLLTDLAAQSMQWASDGEWFLAASAEGLSEDLVSMGYTHLYRVSAEGTSWEQITQEPILLLRHMALSADNTWIVYTSCPFGYVHDCELYTMRADGTGLTQVTESPGNTQYLSWSPDSQDFVFSAYDGEQRNIYRMNPNDTQIELITEGWSMQWSPDGEWIVFALRDIYRIRPDGTAREQLTQDLNVLEHLSWSPDSAWILFEARQDERVETYRMRADGTNPSQITQAGGMDAVWSPDGEWIVFGARVNADYRLYRMRADGSDMQQITDSIGPVHSIQWRPAAQAP